ncbi:MarR family transcriptional regulator [Jatrophihabitans sp.]|uniref:MarR family winged helix-turn-helix transcriptional regulator n=1 Tax=Jatrophihabitans sp. TaxID=1932789 RepID=UPI0030C672F5|nr:MarR family transcriptional regulator [Jatrophihabitans sp.]
MSDFDDDVSRLRAALMRIVRTLDRQVSAGEMTSTQLSVLGSVRRRGPITVGELADLEGVNPTMLSRVLSKLEDAGFLTRAPSAGDRRVIVAEVTAAGRRHHDRLRAERSKVLAEHLDHLPEPHAAALRAVLPSLEALAADLTREPVRS